ncbi:MAG: hypothetical protein H7252_04610 [Cytophaga sp.]|nr:hypothetical protein [Undibacterium sp.]
MRISINRWVTKRPNWCIDQVSAVERSSWKIWGRDERINSSGNVKDRIKATSEERHAAVAEKELF